MVVLSLKILFNFYPEKFGVLICKELITDKCWIFSWSHSSICPHEALSLPFFVRWLSLQKLGICQSDAGIYRSTETSFPQQTVQTFNYFFLSWFLKFIIPWRWWHVHLESLRSIPLSSDIKIINTLPQLQLSRYKSKDLETDFMHSLFNFTLLAFFCGFCNHTTGEKICLFLLHLCFFEKCLAKVHGIFRGERGKLQLGLHHCGVCEIVYVIHCFYRTKVLCRLDMQVNCK